MRPAPWALASSFSSNVFSFSSSNDLKTKDVVKHILQ
jgi:hypothetical protein